MKADDSLEPVADGLQGLIERQVIRIEVLRAQIHAFRALADKIEREAPAQLSGGRSALPAGRAVTSVDTAMGS